jgi:hypothetical protein
MKEFMVLSAHFLYINYFHRERGAEGIFGPQRDEVTES